jgi:hypothetical protein
MKRIASWSALPIVQSAVESDLSVRIGIWPLHPDNANSSAGLRVMVG